MPRVKTPVTRNRGQIIARGPDVWLIRWYVGRSAPGKRLYASETIHGTFTQAQRALTGKVSQVDQGNYVPDAKLTLVEYLTGFKTVMEVTTLPRTGLAQAMRGWLGGRRDIGAGARRDYTTLLRLHVLPELGMTRLDRLTRQRLQDFVTDLEVRKGLSPRSVRYIITVLKTALKHAVRDGLLNKTPAEHLTLPREVTTPTRVLSGEEMGAFLKHPHQRAADTPLWWTLLTTGIRPQEALALTWEDLDLTLGRLHVTKALKRVAGGTWVVGETKTTYSVRMIVLPQATIEILKKHRVTQAAAILAGGASYTRKNLVFPTLKGGHRKVSDVRENWTRDLKAAGIPHVKLYGARHSHFTALLGANVHPKIASDRAGHSSVQITLDYYSHVQPSMQQQAADAMDSILLPAPQAATAR